MENFSEELRYKPQISNHSTVIYRSVTPQSSSDVTISPSSSVGPTEFILPPSCLNFAKSRLNFKLRIPEVDTKFTWTNANLCTMIQRMVLYDTSTSSVLMDVGNFDKFATMVVPAGTHIDSLLSKAFVSGTPSITEADASTRPVEDISKSNGPAVSTSTSILTALNANVIGTTAWTNAQAYPVVLTGSTTTTTTTTIIPNYTGQTNQDIGSYAPFTGRRQFYISPVGNGAGGGDAFFNVSIPFEAFKLTVLSTNKLVYCPSNLCLQIYWSAGNQFCFTANANNNTTTNQTCAVNPIVSGLNITLACESNLAIIKQLMDLTIQQGVVLPIPYCTTTRQSISASTAHSYSLNLTKGYGNRILALITAPFSNANTNSVGAQYHARGNLTVYNTLLNNVALLYPAGIDASKGQDYSIANKPFLENSSIQALGEYIFAEWLHCDSFVGQKPIHEIDATANEIDGLDVGVSSTWTFQSALSASTAYNYITIIVGQKTLQLTSAGAIVI